MQIYIYIYICTDIHTHILTYLLAYALTYLLTHLLTYLLLDAHKADTWIRVSYELHTDILKVNVCVCTHAYIYMNIYIHVCTHTYMNVMQHFWVLCMQE